MKANLILHSGGQHTTLKAINELPTPPQTETWKPIPHGELIQLVKDNIKSAGYVVANQEYALARNGLWMFGMMQLEGATRFGTERTMVAAVRQSHDKTFPAGMLLGDHVFVCDNLAFSGDIEVMRRNTKFSQDDLPAMVESAVSELVEQFRFEDERMEAYRNSQLNEKDAAHLILMMNDAGALKKTDVTDVWKEFRNPRHIEFLEEGHTVWTLQNAVTEVLKGTNLFMVPKMTQALHGVLDSHVGLN